MNAMVRASAILSNGPFILNPDCDHYIYNSLALREGMCFMMDRSGDRICYIQFLQRFEGIDPSDRYANHNTVFFDGNMRALDGLEGPVYVGTGCLFRRFALYGFHPPRANEYAGLFGQIKYPALHIQALSDDDEEQPLNVHPDLNLPKKFGNSQCLVILYRGCGHRMLVIGGSSAHLAAVLQGLLKVIVGIEISFTLTSKCTAEDENDIYANLYVVKWTSLFIVPITIMVINVVALVLGFSRTMYSVIPQWNKFFGGAFFSFWVLAHLYPFVKGFFG
ncbi:hypothetical protein Scep_002372 [Stephania cephalantha]|uniref:Uncharacterized protein n=1 Tax=Stephania cephalantha TaxID=152367 RepID=A0AAP0LA17_9MAGN